MNWSIPNYVPWAVLAVAVFISSFLTYHDLRRQGTKPFSLIDKIWQRKKERIEQMEPYLSQTTKIVHELANHIQKLANEFDTEKINKKKLKKVATECLKAINDAQATQPYPADKVRDKVQEILNNNELGMYKLISDDEDVNAMRKTLQQLRFNTSHPKLKTDLKEFLDESCHMGEALLFMRYADSAGLEVSSVHNWIKTQESWMEYLSKISSEIVADLDEILSMRPSLWLQR